jgi:hypothetical protein
MEDLFDQINEIYREQLSKCSEICRKIVFSLFAIVWALSYHEGSLIFNTYSIVVSIILVGYLVIDTLQYFLTAISYRKHFDEIKKAIANGGSPEKIRDKEVEKREGINNRSYRFMILKVALLPFAFIGILITLAIKMWG